MTVHREGALFRVRVTYQLPHQERCEGVFLGSEQNTRDVGIGALDIAQPRNRIVIDDTVKLGV